MLLRKRAFLTLEIIQYRAPVTTIGTNALRQLASSKSAEIAVKTPDLRPALALQMEMLHLLIDAADELDDSCGAAAPELTPDRVMAKWARGVPAFRNVTVAFPTTLKALPPRMCEVLERGGAGDSAAHIKAALAEGHIDGESLLRVSFARNQKAIRTSAIHMGMAPDLVWLVGELASSPLAHLLQSRVLSILPLQDAVRAWDRGYCLCCGSWPALIEMLNGDGGRVLCCSYCAAGWQMTSHRCVYCGNGDGRFVAAAPDMAHQDRRLELCGACGSYTKAIAVSSLTPFPLMAIEDLATLDLDQAAMGREYSRPPLFDLDTIDPPALSPCP